MADPAWVDGVTPLNSANMTKLQTRDERGVPNGYAPLGADTKVPAVNLPDLSGTYQALAQKGQPNGYASLDAGGKLPVAQVPDISATYQPVAQKGQPNGYVGLDGASNVAVAGYVQALHGLIVGNAANAGYSIDATHADVGGRKWLLAGLSGEANPRFAVDATGVITWGPGNAAADANLYRAAVGMLETDGQFVTKGTITMAPPGATTNGFVFQPNGNPGGYTAFGVFKVGDGAWSFVIYDTGQIAWGPGGSIAPDTNLYRAGPGLLATTAQFQAASIYTAPWTVVGGGFLAGWGDYGGAYGNSRFRKGADGLVNIEAMVYATAGGTGTMFVMPAGMRPNQNIVFPGFSGAGAVAWIQVAPDGSVLTNTAILAGSWVSFVISYYADQ